MCIIHIENILQGTNLFLIAGIHVSKKIKKLGMKSSDTAQIFFEDVKVPVDYIIGEEGMGFIYQMIQFQDERISGIALGNRIFLFLM